MEKIIGFRNMQKKSEKLDFLILFSLWYRICWWFFPLCITKCAQVADRKLDPCWCWSWHAFFARSFLAYVLCTTGSFSTNSIVGFQVCINLFESFLFDTLDTFSKGDWVSDLYYKLFAFYFFKKRIVSFLNIFITVSLLYLKFSLWW